jgi:glycosyltransferase involved in cell wall biosynthesis
MSADAPSPALSLVIPVYNEEDNVGPLHAELTAVARALGRAYEIVFVDDGSRDETRARLEALREDDEHVRVVELDGNFGEAAALSAGFAHARGAIVVTLDGDGQNDPADIPALLARLVPGVNVVSGRRRERKEAFLSRVLPSRIANWVIVQATGVPVHDCGCGLKAYRREVLAGVQLPRGMNRFLPAVLGVDPSHVAEVWVNDRRRGSGRSHYGLSRTFVVLRDLLALPLLVRRARGHTVPGLALGGAQAALVGFLLVAVVGALGWPAKRVPALEAGALAALAAGAGWSVSYNVRRYARARERGVFRVRGTG